MSIIIEKIFSEKRLNNAIASVDRCIPTKSVSDKAMIIAFEKIDALCKRGSPQLYDLSDYMYKNKHPKIKRFDTFFKKVHAIIRKLAEADKSYFDNLATLSYNIFKESSKILNPKYYAIHRYVPLNYDTAHEAYQKTLDFYDPNIEHKNKGGVSWRCWSGFFSLIGTKNGKIEGCYLGDTMDRDLFYEYLKMPPMEMAKNKK